MMKNYQCSEGKAFAKLEGMRQYDLQREADKLSEAAKHGRLAHSVRTHRRRVLQVLRGMPQNEVSRRGTPFISPTHGAEEMDRDRKQLAYDSAYLAGDRDYRLVEGHGNPHDPARDPTRWQGYQDGHEGRAKKFFR